jgi:hypothetical protein
MYSTGMGGQKTLIAGFEEPMTGLAYVGLE